MNINNMTQTLRLREYYYMLVRHKTLFFGTVWITMIIALVLAFTMPKIYRAETVLLVEDQKILEPLISGLAISPSFAARMRTLREELLSWQRLTLLVETLKLDKGVHGALSYEKLIHKLRDNIDVKLRGQDIITIRYEGMDPKEAQNIVKTLSDIIQDGSIVSVDLEANSAIQFIQEQLELYRTKLEDSEEKLRTYRELYSSVLPIATRMNEQLVGLNIELSNLLVENTEAHPRVIQIRQQIVQLEKQRNQYMKEAQTEGLDIEDVDFAKLISSVPLQEQQMAKLQRDYAVNENIYQRLSQKLETAKISQTLEASDNGAKFRILEPARLPLTPVKPSKPLFLFGGLIVGFGLGTLFVMLIEMMNNSLRNVDEARQLLDLPILGTIATIRPEDLIIGEKMRVEASV